MIESNDKEAIFPEAWYKKSGTPETLMKTHIQCFDHLDYTKLPNDVLSNHLMFKRLLLSLRDFTHAKSAVTFIPQDVDYDKTYDLAELRRFQAYESSLIASYSRPFSESSGDIPKLS